VPPEQRRVILAANSSWNIVNFRNGLIRALKSAGYEPIVIAPVDPAAEDRMADLAVERRTIRMERSGLNPLADLRLLLDYRRVLRRERPLAFLGFTIKPNIYGCLASRFARVPAIANISGLGTVFIKRGPLLVLVSRLYRAALKAAAVVFFQNPDDLELFVGRKMVRREQARLLPGSGVDLDRFRATPPPEGSATFLLIGRLLGDKGVREFVDAARLLRSELPEARFQLLGPIDEGNRTAVQRAEVDEWVRDGVIEYLGATDDVRPFVERSTAVVLPSYREGLPRSLLEAAAMSRPLIASDVPGCREVVRDGENGLLCAVRSAASLADAMKRLANLSNAERARMGEAGRRLVGEKFSEATVIRAYLDALGQFDAPRS
jgi:glycosyltransferase involved in cell wall biosynthesis